MDEEVFTSETLKFQCPFEFNRVSKHEKNPGIISGKSPINSEAAADLMASHRSQQEIKVNDVGHLPECSKTIP